MAKLSMEKKLAIANSGGFFEEDSNSWVGTKIRKGKRHGVVISDKNGSWRILTVEFKDGLLEEIWMDNIGFNDPESNKQYEWYCICDTYQKWLRF